MPDRLPSLPVLPPGFACGVTLADPRPDDVALVARLGVPECRLVASWSHLQPEGTGRLDPDRLDRVLDGLAAIGVRVTLTLLTGTVPHPLALDGGWLNRDTVDRAVDFAAAMVERYRDRVDAWIPVDEPTLTTLAPIAVPLFEALPAAHHVLLAHGRTAIALRAAGARTVGCANHHAPMWPVSEDAADIGATKLFDTLWNGLFLEPMLLGRYPVDLAPLLDGFVHDGDLATIRQPLDFYGISYYAPMRIGATDEDAELPFELCETVGYPTTDLGWPVVPDALRELLILKRARFRAALPPLKVTGCGAAYADPAAQIDYLDAHLQAVATAVQRGVDVRGLSVTALRDDDGPWGLATAAGAAKPSLDWYSGVIASQSRSLG